MITKEKIEQLIIDNDSRWTDNWSDEDERLLEDMRQARKDSFIAFLQDEHNEPLRLWQALLIWAKKEYKDEIVPHGEKPEIHKIFCGFDQEASDDTFYWE